MNRSKACKDWERELVLYYYGESGPGERPRVEAHVGSCAGCRRFFDDLRRLLPLTVSRDEPEEAFWRSYSREMRGKLSAVEERRRWWSGILAFQPWRVPAMAAAVVLAVALSLTLGKKIWSPDERRPTEEVLLEVLPMAQHIEFFSSMELLDDLDILEAAGTRNGSA